MSLKYNCPLCGFEMITDFLKRGDIYRCISCGNKVDVPYEALYTDEEPNLRKTIINPYRNEYEYGDDPALVPGNTPFITEEEFPPAEKVKKIRSKEWGVWSVIKFVIAFMLAQIPVYFISSLLTKIVSLLFFPENIVGEYYFNKYYDEFFEKTFSLLAYFVPIALIYYSVVKRHGNDFFEALKLSRISKKEVIFYTKISIAIVLAVGAFGILIEITPLKDYIPESVPLDEYFNKGYFELAFFSFMVILVPIQEELIFRGFVFQGLRNKFSPLTSATIVTILFTYLHSWQLGGSTILLIPIFGIAILLIYIRIKTDSLTKCIIVHQIYNTTLVIIIWTFTLIFGLDSNAQ